MKLLIYGYKDRPFKHQSVFTCGFVIALEFLCEPCRIVELHLQHTDDSALNITTNGVSGVNSKYYFHKKLKNLHKIVRLCRDKYTHHNAISAIPYKYTLKNLTA